MEAELATNTLRDVKERKSLMADIERRHVVSFSKQELNNFLTCCGASTVREVEMGSSLTTTKHTRRRNISEASEVMVTVLQTSSPSHPGELWEDLRDSDKICEALSVTNREELNLITAKESDMKYLLAPSESYSNASSGNVRKQVLSIMSIMSCNLWTVNSSLQTIKSFTECTKCTDCKAFKPL